jgi:hypothetical protein
MADNEAYPRERVARDLREDVVRAASLHSIAGVGYLEASILYAIRRLEGHTVTSPEDLDALRRELGLEVPDRG